MAAQDTTEQPIQRTPTPTGAHAVVAAAKDPARRPDVLFRVRRPPGQEASAWWHVGAFVVTAVAVVALLSFIPG